MSARHRQHKKKIAEAQQALAEREVDFVGYVRVIADMERLCGDTQALALVRTCHARNGRDCDRLRAIVDDLEKAAPA